MLKHVKMVFVSMVLATISAILLLAVSLLITFTLGSAFGDMVELDKLELEAHTFTPGSRDVYITQNPNLPGVELGQQYNLTMNLGLFDWFYWDNKVFSRTDRDVASGWGQFRYVSWQWSFGVRLTENLMFEYMHRSQHLLDVPYPAPYPLENGLGIRFTIYENKKSKYSVF